MNSDSCRDMFYTTVLGHIFYTMNGWGWMVTKDDENCFNSIMRRAIKMGYLEKRLKCSMKWWKAEEKNCLAR